MIAKLTGIIDSFGDKFLILDVNGVGYHIYAGTRTLTQIGQIGEAAKLLIDMQVREDSMTLYGFIDQSEQQWFRMLNSVQGVGAKVALAILSAAPPERLQLAIASQDKAALTAADGVGPKLATRILTELKDKAIDLTIPVAASAMPATSKNTLEQNTNTATQSSHIQDAISALVNLGYAKADAYQAVTKNAGNDDADVQTLIRLALKDLAA